MMDAFVLLTPFLLLAVIAIFGFVGCGFQPSASEGLTASPSSGPTTGGTPITITGSNSDFASNVVLTFGSSPDQVINANAASVSISSSTTLSAVTPAYPLAKAVDLKVSYTNGQGQTSSASGSKAFTYTAPPVAHVETVIGAAPGGPKITAPPLTLQGGELLIASLQWAVPTGGSLATPTFTGASFQPVTGGGPFSWNSMNVQTFFAFNTAAGQVNIVATLPQASPDVCTLCVTAYDFADPANPIYSPVESDPAYKGTKPQAPAIAANPGDMVYAVAYAANSGGVFPGTNPLSPGPGFTAESSVGGDPLVEDLSVTTATSVVAQATNTTTLGTPRSWILAMGIKAAG